MTPDPRTFMWALEEAELLDWLAKYKGPKFHACLTDPPYHLTSITERFGDKDSAPAKEGTDGVFQRSSKGFMGQTWDGGDIAFQRTTWEAIKEVLYPGAFGMAFAGSRGYHRMAVAIEDAGFIIHPAIGWVFGSGFPKATRIDTKIDQRGGQVRYEEQRIQLAKHIRERRIVSDITIKEMASWFPYAEVTKNWERIDTGGRWPNPEDYEVLIERIGCEPKFRNVVKEEAERILLGKSDNGIAGGTHQHAGQDDAWGFDNEYNITAPASPLAKSWVGHRYGLQALKPALEFVCVFQKPYEGRPLDNITKTGAGALNIDAGRIATNPDKDDMLRTTERGKRQSETWEEGSGFKNESNPLTGVRPEGRWPANFALAHLPGCKKKSPPYGDEDDVETVEDWDCAEGCPVKALDEQSGDQKSIQSMRGDGTDAEWNTVRGYSAEGGASRFFFNADWNYEVEERLVDSNPMQYCAKASREERDMGLEHLNPKSMRYGDGRANSHECFQMEGDGRNTVNRPVKNFHPTVKPISLNQWLASLLLPPKDYAPRRLLVPFAGVASEMTGGLQAGWDEVVGVEMAHEYIEIGKARLNYWGKTDKERKKVDTVINKKKLATEQKLSSLDEY